MESTGGMWVALVTSLALRLEELGDVRERVAVRGSRELRHGLAAAAARVRVRARARLRLRARLREQPRHAAPHPVAPERAVRPCTTLHMYH